MLPGAIIFPPCSPPEYATSQVPLIKTVSKIHRPGSKSPPFKCVSERGHRVRENLQSRMSAGVERNYRACLRCCFIAKMNNMNNSCNNDGEVARPPRSRFVMHTHVNESAIFIFTIFVFFLMFFALNLQVPRRVPYLFCFIYAVTMPR